MDLAKLKRPVFVIDRAKVRRNAGRMAEKARRSGIILRPHVKTHQSAAVAGWLREFGVRAVTVSSVDMAAYFLRAGWTDVLISVPVNVHQIPEIDELASAGTVHVIVESGRTAQALLEGAAHPLDIWIEVDAGYHRTGLPVGRPEAIAEVAGIVRRGDRHRLRGLLCHDGHTYAANSPGKIREIAAASIAALSKAVDALARAGVPGLSISVGDTPSCSMREDFPPPIIEIRPGNFVFYDLTQSGIGACGEADIAAAVACPVIATHPERDELVVYGGGVHISKEAVRLAGGEACYGKVCRLRSDGTGWDPPLAGAFVSSLSQEQGILRIPPLVGRTVGIGDTLIILPVHACLTANLHAAYYVIGEGWVDKFRS